MNIEEKKDFLLYGLYSLEDGMLVLGQILTHNKIEWDIKELREIVENLKMLGLIVYQVQKQDYRAQLTGAGKEFCETTSFSSPGIPVLELITSDKK